MFLFAMSQAFSAHCLTNHNHLFVTYVLASNTLFAGSNAHTLIISSAILLSLPANHTLPHIVPAFNILPHAHITVIVSERNPIGSSYAVFEIASLLPYLSTNILPSHDAVFCDSFSISCISVHFLATTSENESVCQNNFSLMRSDQFNNAQAHVFNNHFAVSIGLVSAFVTHHTRFKALDQTLSACFQT
jgi:hypothetical protein